MNKTNFLIDTATLLAFLTVMEPRFSGVTIHEWLSLALAATLIVHLLLHFDWIVCVGGRFFRQLWHVSRLKFVVDALLFIGFITVSLSGILISRSILPTLGVSLQGGMAWRWIHSISADVSMLLLGVHFALSWGWIRDRVAQYALAPIGRLLRPAGMQLARVPVEKDRLG